MWANSIRRFCGQRVKIASMLKRNKPTWELDETVLAGTKAVKVLGTHGKELLPRLPAGTTEGLRTDLGIVTSAQASATPTFPKAASGRPSDEHSVTKDGADLLSRLRNALVGCSQAAPRVLRAAGVGIQVSPGKINSVAASLTAMLDASKTYPAAFRAAGILETDLGVATEILKSVLQAEETPPGVEATVVDLTAQKDAAQLRIEHAVTTIAAAGQLQFRKDPATRALFEALTPVPKAKPEAKTKAKSGAVPAAR
jgi:hypothetical protein